MKIHCRYDALVDPKTLKPNPRNPHKHTIEGATNLIKLFGYNGIRNPITVSNQSGLIVTGHRRHMAALMAEMEVFPVVFQDFDSEDHEYAHLVADNGASDWSHLDRGMVNAELENLELEDTTLLGLKDFVVDPAELPPKQKKPKLCPHCGENVNAPPV